MEVRHDDPELFAMELDAAYSGTWLPILTQYRKTLNLVRQASNQRELYNWKGLRLEKLGGKRNHQHSMRLTKQWRLIVEFESREGPNNNICAVKGIEDYH